MLRVRALLLSAITATGLSALTGADAIAAHTAHAGAHRSHALPKYSPAFQHRYHVGPKSDPDGDGLNSYYEFLAGTNPLKADSNGDGKPDNLEDRDKDGLQNGTEQEIGSNPAQKDTNGNHVSDASEDRDHDGLSNLTEQRTGLDPANPDTDGNGVPDGQENVGRIVGYDAEAGTIRLWMAGQHRVVEATMADDTSVICAALTSGDGSDPAIDDPSATGDTIDDGSDPGADPSIDDPGVDDPSVDDPYANDPSSSDGIASDGSMCLDGVKRGVWFTNAELSDDPDTGDLMVDVLELAG